MELASSFLTLKVIAMELWLQKSDFNVKIWTTSREHAQPFEKAWLRSSLHVRTKVVGEGRRNLSVFICEEKEPVRKVEHAVSEHTSDGASID